MLGILADGHDDHLDGGQPRRQHEAVVVGVNHDEGAHEAGGHAPARGPYILGLVLLVEESHVETLGKVLPQEVACAALQGLAVLHHGLNGIGVEGSGEALGFALHTLYDGYSHPLLGKFGIHLEHLPGLDLGLFRGGVGGVALLPEEFGGAEERSRAHLPAHHVAPLVAQDGQVAVGMYPVFVGVPDHCFRCRPDDELLFELGLGVHHDAFAVCRRLEAVVGHHGALLGEAGYVLGFLGEEALGDEQGEVGILHAGSFKHLVELGLHLLPDGVAVGFDNHTSADGGRLGKVCLGHQVAVPLAVIVGTLG